jgi:hypothetical protein
MRKIKKKNKSNHEQNPFAKSGFWLELPSHDLLEFKKVMFANSLTSTDFLEHVVKELINQNPDMTKFILTAQQDKLMKQETYVVRYKKSFNKELEAELLYKLLEK